MPNTNLDTAIVIAWPQCTARSDEAFAIFLRKTGILKNLNFRVGHAAVCLINPQTREVLYYDFGRYITPRGYGRARSKYSEPNLKVNILAEFDEDKNLLNVEDIANELESMAKYTHGEGPMVFSVSKTINFAPSKEYADEMVMKGYFPYHGFEKTKASNCARYVTEIMKVGNQESTVGLNLKYPVTFRPTPLFNVVAAKSDETVYSFECGELEYLKKKKRHSFTDVALSILENGFSTYANQKNDDTVHGHINEPERPASVPVTAQWLGGLGEGAWYQVDRIDAHSFEGSKFEEDGTMEYSGVYENKNIVLPEGDIKLTYMCHYGFYSVEMDGMTHRFYRVQ